MTRKRMAATVALVITGAAGLAYAAEKGDPLALLAVAIKEVNENTLAVADQTRSIAKETSTIVEQSATVVQQNNTIVNRTAALANATKELDLKLDAVLNAVAKIEAAPPAAAAPSAVAHPVWLAPYVADESTVDRRLQATTYVLNAGVEPATVTCAYYNANGTRLDVHGGTTRIVQPGALSVCEPSPVGLGPQVSLGWHLVVSDHPVIVTGRNDRRASDGTHLIADNMVVHPLDCSGDQIGLEAACDAVADIEKNGK